jgi:hypothetical protein
VRYFLHPAVWPGNREGLSAFGAGHDLFHTQLTTFPAVNLGVLYRLPSHTCLSSRPKPSIAICDPGRPIHLE